jgi:hypothetical protein
MKEHVLEHRKITIPEAVNMLEILFGSVQSILKDSLNMCCIAAKYVFYLLSREQKKNRVNTYHNFDVAMFVDVQTLQHQSETTEDKCGHMV